MMNSSSNDSIPEESEWFESLADLHQGMSYDNN